MVDLKNVSCNLITIMEEQHFSVAELALRLGVTRQTVYNWLNARNYMTFENLSYLSLISGHSMDEILGLTEWK